MKASNMDRFDDRGYQAVKALLNLIDELVYDLKVGHMFMYSGGGKGGVGHWVINQFTVPRQVTISGYRSGKRRRTQTK